MDAITRNSRWDREPVVGKDGKPIVARITERDIKIFKLLSRYRFLPFDYIHAFIGGSETNLKYRLNLLYRQPNQYINRPHQQRENADANYRYLVYELDERGAECIGAKKPKHARNFRHELMTCQIAASFELGVRANEGVQLIPWTGIVASGKLPRETRESATPHTIAFELDGKAEYVTADWEPFVIRTDGGFTFFPGFEADCATEPIDATDDERSSIRRKFRGYLNIMERRIYTSHFGAETFMIPIVTTSEARMRSMMALLKRMKPEEHAFRFLFKHIPAFTDRDTPPATGHMLAEPWQRIEGGPFKLLGKIKSPARCDVGAKSGRNVTLARR